MTDQNSKQQINSQSSEDMKKWSSSSEISVNNEDDKVLYVLYVVFRQIC